MKVFSELGTDEKLLLLHDEHAQVMRTTAVGGSPLNKRLFTDPDFLSEVARDDNKAKEFIKDFCSLNKSDAEQQLKYVQITKCKPFSEETQKEQQPKFEALKSYFLGAENQALDFNNQLFGDFARGWDFRITVDGNEIFTGKHRAESGGKVTRQEFFAQVKEAIKGQSNETKEKIADFIVNSAAQGYLSLPIYQGSSAVAIGHCTPAMQLNIDTKSRKTNFTIDGTYRGNMGTVGAIVFEESEGSEQGSTIGKSLNQKVDFKFRYDYDGLLMNRQGKLDSVKVEQFDQTITDNVPNKAA